jgi:hypothetical protein
MIRVRGKRLAKTPYMAQGLFLTKKQPIIEATKLMRPIIASVENKEYGRRCGGNFANNACKVFSSAIMAFVLRVIV